MGEHQAVLAEEAHGPLLGRDQPRTAGEGHVGEHLVAHPHESLAGPQQPCEDREQRGLAGAVGPEHGEHLALGGGQGQVQLEVAAAHREARLQIAHPRPPGFQARASTRMTTATTTKSSDSATAESWVTPAPLNAV